MTRTRAGSANRFFGVFADQLHRESVGLQLTQTDPMTIWCHNLGLADYFSFPFVLLRLLVNQVCLLRMMLLMFRMLVFLL
jgi:hypothetical protein